MENSKDKKARDDAFVSLVIILVSFFISAKLLKSWKEMPEEKRQKVKAWIIIIFIFAFIFGWICLLFCPKVDF